MPPPPQRCAGANQPPAHTYPARRRGAGGIERDTTLANCPCCPAYDLGITPAGLLAPHTAPR